MRKTRNRPLAWILALLASMLAMGSFGADTGKSPNEYQVKAVFLYHFAKFVDWPGAAFNSTNAPFIIGIIGEDPFGPVLDETVRSEVVGERKLLIKRFAAEEPIGSCHILFISRSEKDRAAQIVEEVTARPVLTVADFPKAIERGVMINLQTQSSVRMEINPTAAEESGLRVSSKLLNLATIVKPPHRTELPAP